MDAFMRFTGVVRERVVCHPRGDGLMQLDQLDEDCWKHVRRYLMVEDIRISALASEGQTERSVFALQHFRKNACWASLRHGLRLLGGSKDVSLD
ncbi:hypothetical protein V5799_023429 [Amblyomma americanum]|uniref:Uncharacterized protein n=1 Tax=Amblyomma americanum TaxID=6943 RepID=A0AAQ4FHN0_AMBAM